MMTRNMIEQRTTGERARDHATRMKTDLMRSISQGWCVESVALWYALDGLQELSRSEPMKVKAILAMIGEALYEGRTL